MPMLLAKRNGRLLLGCGTRKKNKLLNYISAQRNKNHQIFKYLLFSRFPSMNEKRLENYLNLIQKLLSCAKESEVEQCLTHNKELLDLDLIQTINQVATRFEQNGEQEQAKYLNFLVVFLANRFGISEDEIDTSPISESEDYINFFKKILRTTANSNSNSEVVYPLLQKNLDKLNEIFAERFFQWATDTLSSLESEQAYLLAKVILNFSVMLQEFSFGNWKNNQEIAIKGYQSVTGVITHDGFPYEWAGMQNNIGNLYNKRISGKKTNNLEVANFHYRESLKVYTQEAFPYEWANTQNNLGTAYNDRIKGNKADNLEAAIFHYRESLKVYTQETCPYEWARTQKNLGTAYCGRIKGDKADNLEAAIFHYRESLKVYTQEAFPYEWSGMQNSLGNFYSSIIKGDKADNLEAAIFHYRECLKVRTPEAFPDEWAGTQNNLGTAYCERIKGDKADNLETAISCFQESLGIYTPEAFPYSWANTKNNMGNAYCNRIKGDKADNIEKAISFYRESLEVYTQETFPYEWARTQNNLGNAYKNRIKGDKADNIEKSISFYQESLKVWTSEDFPKECLLTGANLGSLAFREGNWQLAIEAYNRAIEALEISRSWAMTPQSKQEVMEADIDIYHNIVQSYLKTEQISLALEYVERSKTRNLVELLFNRDLKPRGEFSPTIIRAFARLRHEILTEQIYLANQERIYSSSSESVELSQSYFSGRTRLKQLHQELDELIQRDISPIDPTFSLTQKVEIILFSEIQSLIDEHTAIFEWYITGDKILTFLVTRHSSEPQIWQSSTNDLTNLVNQISEYLLTYYNNRQQWRKDLETSLLKIAEILHLDEILSFIPKKCNRLILIPHRILHILPLHALPVSSQIGKRSGGEVDGKYLFDLFSRGIQYAPSCQLLKVSQNQQRPDFQCLFAIQNPTEDLISSDLEVETIRFLFPDADVLAKQAASKAFLKLHQNLPLTNCLHFSCHGTFNLQSPLESALILSKNGVNLEDSYLTLAEIFELSLQQCRLVTLSACETGFTDFSSISDEYIGLTSGFLFAGSPSIVSSLWTVDDFSTAFLMIKFYKNLRNEQESQVKDVVVALKDAQNWLRNLTPDTGEDFLRQIESYIDALYPDKPRKARAFKTGALKRIKEFGSRPFANPFYWAAFTATGL